MKEYINRIKSKDRAIRQQYLWTYLILLMIVIGGIWIFSLTYHLSNKKIVEQTKEEIKPLELFVDGFKNSFKDITANVGSIKLNSEKNISEISSGEMIPLTVIDK
jgi:competence protein ComGF